MRKVIGVCQCIGGIGLLLGFELDIAIPVSAIFIIIMMLVAIIVRIRMRDIISDSVACHRLCSFMCINPIMSTCQIDVGAKHWLNVHTDRIHEIFFKRNCRKRN